MAGVNKTFLCGNLTADPEVKVLANGMYIANFRMATNTYAGKDEAGNPKEAVTFHNVVLFGKRAEVLGQFLSKGTLVWVEGRIKNDDWTDKEGQKHYRTEIQADDIQLLGPKKSAAAA